ncbi:glycogen synthase isoform 1 [Leucoagaricus gongylophorus]
MSLSYRPCMNSRICKPLLGAKSSETISMGIILDDTWYKFITGRYEYRDKDVDTLIDSLSRLNLKLSKKDKLSSNSFATLSLKFKIVLANVSSVMLFVSMGALDCSLLVPMAKNDNDPVLNQD